METQTDFNTIANDAENTLKATEGSMDMAMISLPAEQLETMKWDILEKAKSSFFDTFSCNIENWKNREMEDAFITMKTAFTDIAAKIPPELGETFAHEILENKNGGEKWKRDSSLALFAFLSLLGEKYEYQEKTGKKISENTDPIIPLPLHFNTNDFHKPPEFFGAHLPKGLSLTIEGDTQWRLGFHLEGGTIIAIGQTDAYVGEYMREGLIDIRQNTSTSLGFEMTGGTIYVRGNAGNNVGISMKGGTIEVFGNAKEYMAVEMTGGTINFHGEVASFHKTAFLSKNKGSIIWKDRTIWQNGDWTDIGREMNANGQIPIVAN